MSTKPPQFDTATMKWMLQKLVERGHIAAALEFMEPRSSAAYILKDEMCVSSWESVESPCGGRGDDVEWSGGCNPEDFEFSDVCWQTLYDYLPDQVRDWIIEVFCEEGP